jgi:hypothetical protein
VALQGIEVVKGSFPSARDGGQAFVDAVRQSLPATGRLPLASLEASPAVEPTRRPAAPARPKVVPPRIVFVSGPVLLIRIDGDPVIKPIEGTNFLRVVNTRTLLFQDKYSSRFYLPVADGWLMGPGLNATWTVPTRRPPGLDELRKSFAAGKGEAALDEAGDAEKVHVGAGKAPAVVVLTGPAELVRTAGRPELSPVPGTRLAYVRNTKSDVFFDAASRRTFVLSSGRWFRARETRGPWEFVDEADLPRDFSRIPRAHPKAAVLMHVPGAPEPAPLRKASRPGDVYAGPDGNTYRARAGGGWEKTNGTDWYPVQTSSPYDKELVRRLEREETARQAGEASPRP